jgi:phosphoenolpyruvate synthase/pyruvate phosphate dikinase
MSPNSAISSPHTPADISGTTTPVGHRMVAARLADGYRLFSDFISSDPLRSTTIFRRFDRLAIRNLLYLESELAALESEVEKLDMDEIPETMINHLGDWILLRDEAEYAEEDTPENISEEEAKKQELMMGRMRLVKKIRIKVKEYRKQACS